MASYKDLQAQIEVLKQQAEAARKTEIAHVVADIKAKMTEYGLTLADLGGTSRRSKAGTVVAVKFRHPQTGETWTGRGKQPRWLAAEVAAGKSKEDFAV